MERLRAAEPDNDATGHSLYITGVAKLRLGACCAVMVPQPSQRGSLSGVRLVLVQDVVAFWTQEPLEGALTNPAILLFGCAHLKTNHNSALFS